MQVAEGFLIRAHEEDAEVVLLAVRKGMQIEGRAHALRVDELVGAPVAVAGDVRNDRLAGRELRQAVHRHDREQLVDGPCVGQRLEYAEIAVIDIGKRAVDVRELLGRVLELFLFLGDAVDDRPEILVREGPLAERDAAGDEQLAHFVPVIDGVVVALLKVADGQALQGLAEVDHRFRHVLGQGFGDALARFGDAHVEDVEQ